MSKERETVVVQTEAPKQHEEKILGANEEVIKSLEASAPEIPVGETKEQRKARLITVLSRSIIADVLNVPLPAHLKGEWVRADAMQVRAMQMLGFRIDNEHAVKRAIHNDGTSSGRIADVIFMVTDTDNYETIHEIREEQRKQSEYRGKRAEREFQSATERDTGGDIGTFNETKVEHIPFAKVIENQTSPQ